MLVCVQVASLIILQFPGVQTFAVQKVAGAVSDKLDGRISIGKVYFVFFNKLILKDISIVSNSESPMLDSLETNCGYSDTLLRCNKLSLSLDVQHLIDAKIKINKISLSDGEFNLQTEAFKRTNLDRIFRLSKDAPKDTAKKGNLNLLANTLKVNDFRFTMKNHTKYVFKGDSTANFADLDVRDISIDISDVHLKSDTLYAQINCIKGRDKSGLKIGTLSGKARVCGTEALVSDFYLADSYSVLSSRYFYFRYSSPKDFADFTQKVKMGISLQNAFINFRTIGKIAPTLFDSRLAFYINGEITGTVKDIDARNLVATSESGLSFINLNARINGLPDISRTMAIAEIKGSSTIFTDLARIISSINNTPLNSKLASLAPLTHFEFKGNLMGLLDDFVADGLITSPSGRVSVDLLFRNERNAGSRFNGTMVLENVDAGAILSNDKFGKASAFADFDALFRRDGGGIELTLDTLGISSFGFNGYDFSGIAAKGTYVDNAFRGSIVSTDPNFNFSYNGLFSFVPDFADESQYDFIAEVGNINLAAINVDRSNPVSQLTLVASANVKNTGDGYVNGKIDISDVVYKGPKGIYNIGDINIKSLNSSDVYTATLRSPFAEVEYSGPAPIYHFAGKFADMVLAHNMDNWFVRDTSRVYADGLYNFNMQTFNTMPVFEILNKDYYISDGTRASVMIGRDNVLEGKVLSGRLAKGVDFLKGLELQLGSDYTHGTRAVLHSENVKLAGMLMDSVSLNVDARSNELGLEFSFMNDTTASNSATILGNVELMQGRGLQVNLLEGSHINIEGEHWKFSPAELSVSDSLFTVQGFNLYNGGQSLSMQGAMSKYSDDSINFRLDNFNVGIFNFFLNKSFNFQGYFSGNGIVSDLYRAPKVFFDITGNDVSVYGNEVGSLKMMSKWNDVDKELNLYLKSSINNRRTFLATGYFKPETSWLNLNASLEDLSVSYFEPFLADIISKSSGSMSGDLRLSGTLDKLALTGTGCHFNKLGFLLNFTQVPYTIDGPFELNEKGIFFKDLPLYDKFGSRGIINGKLGYDYFRDLNLDTRITFTNLQCLNTNEHDNEFFYGSAFATGSMLLKGPLNNIDLQIDAVSNKRTSIHVPLSNSATATRVNLLTFVENDQDRWIDPYDTLSINRKEVTRKSSNLKVDIAAQVTPDAEIMIEIDKSVGDVIRAKGNGVINLDIDPSREVFDIFGDYHVTDGSYKFVLAGIASRDFILQPGGTIVFNGDIANTNLSLDALYSTKTSINPLIADTSSISTRRNVNCIIGMQGKMMNPQLNFEIDIPDLDPTTKIRVESALNTQGKIQKQFMAILVSGGFIPDEQSGIANNSSILYSNASEMLSNQISNIFHQLGIPLDLGLNYQPGERGTDIFDVAVSTQLFNNRVIINGNIGNDPYAQNNRDVIGNIDVEVKLDNPGNIRLDLFSHAEDQYSSYNNNNNSQRSGIGIVYQKEFNSFKSLLRGKSKAQKAYEKQERLRRKAQKRLQKENKKPENQ